MDTSGLSSRQRSAPASTSSTSTSIDPRDSTGSISNVDIKSTDQTSSILSSSVQGASYLVLLQFISRMLTFTLNQVLLRFTSAETLGIASVQLELLLSTILFLSREGVRCAAIRVNDDPVEVEDSKQGEKQPSSDTGNKKRIAPGSEAYRLQKLVNMVYAPIPVGILMTCLAVGYTLSQINDQSEEQYPGYRLSIYLYGISALIELLAEPMFMIAQYKLWSKPRVSVEGAAVIVRCVLTCALTVYGARKAITGSETEETTKNTMGVLAFAIAQFTYGLLTLVGFLWAFWHKSTERRDMERRRMIAAIKRVDGVVPDDMLSSDDDTVPMSALLPRKLTRVGKDGKEESFFFDKELLKLSKTLTSQSLLKHILTEGDKMMMAKFTNEASQGVYAFVVNYGSLVARILFQPLEETSRTLFSRLLSDIPSVSTLVDIQNHSSTREKSSSLTETQVDNLTLSRKLLLTIMKFHVLLGLVFIAFGTHYTATLIDLVVGRNWSTNTSAPQVLSLYCYYVPIMGINGITEAVVQAVASEKELYALSYWMIGFSAVFCSTAAFLMGTMGLGAEGIVLANCVNLMMRIVWSVWFLSGYYGRHIPDAGKTHHNSSSTLARFANVPWWNIVPRPAVLAAFAGAFVLTATTESVIGWHGLYNKAVHLGIGVAAFAVVMGVVFVSEKQFLRDIQGIVRQRRR